MNRTGYNEYNAFLAVVNIDDTINELSSKETNYTQDITQLKLQEQDLVKADKTALDNISNLKKTANFKELEIKSLDINLKNKQKKLSNTSQVKEYTALTQELSLLEQEKTKLDEELLTTWQDLETAEKAYKNLQKINLENIELIHKNIRTRENQLKEISKEKSQLLEDRQAHIKYIPEELYKKYTFKKEATNKGAARVQSDSCSACFYPISQHDLSALKDNQLRECKDCYRILYQKS